MRILVLLVVISFLIMLFPLHGLGIVTEFLSTGGSLFLNFMPMFLDFVSLALSSILTTRWLSTLLSFFIFANLLIVIVAFVKGATVSYFATNTNEDTELYEENDDRLVSPYTNKYKNVRKFRKGKFVNERVLVSTKKHVDPRKSLTPRYDSYRKRKFGK